MKRRFANSIKSVIHFDYPYPDEWDDGLRDEVGQYEWYSENAVLVGSQKPAEVIVEGTPKFGYRCLRTISENQYIYSRGDWSLAANSNYEVSFWFRAHYTRNGNMFALFSGTEQVLVLKMDSTLHLQAVSSSMDLNLTSTSALSLDTWHFIRLQLSVTTAIIFVDDTLVGTQAITRTAITATEARIGGAGGYFDEFVFRTTLTSGIQTAPLQATLHIDNVGGFGSGTLGDVVLNKSGVLCSTGNLGEVISERENVYQLKQVHSGMIHSFAVGDEVMAINRIFGSYAFTKISRIVGDVYYFDSSIGTVDSRIGTVFVQVPNFQTLTIQEGVAIQGSWSWAGSSAGGYIAFRCKGDCTILGSLLTKQNGSERVDPYDMCHAKLIDHFLPDTGGGIFLTCGGVLTAPSSARIGSSWSGAGEGGDCSGNSNGGGGGAGYGGGMGNPNQASHTNYPYIGGDSLAAASGYRVEEGSSSANLIGGKSGASVVILARTLKVDEAALSTGGSGGNASTTSTGGGGTGFCYIACERMI